MTGQSILRSVRPEARVVIDGVVYNVGGLVGQPNHAYLTDDWLDAMKAEPGAMRLVGIEIGTPIERLQWGRRRHAAPNAAWPPKGLALRMDYAPPRDAAPTDGSSDASPLLTVSVHYELYHGVPAMCKWISIKIGPASPSFWISSLLSEWFEQVRDGLP